MNCSDTHPIKQFQSASGLCCHFGAEYNLRCQPPSFNAVMIWTPRTLIDSHMAPFLYVPCYKPLPPHSPSPYKMPGSRLPNGQRYTAFQPLFYLPILLPWQKEYLQCLSPAYPPIHGYWKDPDICSPRRTAPLPPRQNLLDTHHKKPPVQNHL